ncbi:MAG: RDD family protein [Candidatus Caenarcaniphilales bacterium]|jgi:uncharacterized RDD family membrane protein YckC|nr:RDD family protein [Candidatus Caenarcaniphilales bacterium]
MNSNTNYKNASFYKRLSAFYLAQLFIIIGTASVVSIINVLQPLAFTLWSYNFWILICCVYFGILISDQFFQCLLGANLAKAILGLRIIDHKEFKKINIVATLLRTLFGFISFLALGLGFIALAFNSEKRALHDILGGSKVVQKKQGMILGFISNLIALSSLLVGLSVSFVLISSIVLSPIAISKSLEGYNKYSYYQAGEFATEASKKIAFHNGTITALLGSEYLNFHFDSENKYNQVTLKDALTAGFKYWDLFLLWDSEDQKIYLALTIPKLIIKDIDSKDISIYDGQFLISKQNIISEKLFDLFDIEYIENGIKIQLTNDDLNILNDNNLEPEDKLYLIDKLKSIKILWRKYLSDLSIETISALSDEEKPLKNKIEMIVNTQTGFVTNVTIPEASSNKIFNKLCEDFGKEIPRMRLIPESLKAKSLVRLNFELEYLEIL